MASKKKTSTGKVAKKITKKKSKPGGCRDINSLLGKTFYFCDPWEWDDDDNPLVDSDGEVVHEICGEWEIRSVDEEDDDVWAYIEIDGHDFEIQLPVALLPESIWED